MRIVCISDTHNHNFNITVPDGDVLIHAGDATMKGTVPEVAAFGNWFCQLPHEHKIYVPGNHDILLEENRCFAEGLIRDVHILNDLAVTINGINFYGTPWQPIFGDWAFNRKPSELDDRFAAIPSSTNILVTHTPPRDVLDLNPRYQHVGSVELQLAVRRVQPAYNIFGHIHSAYGYMKNMQTTFINASICDDKYRPVNRPIVIDV